MSLIATKWGPDDLEYRVNTVSSIACLPRTALMAVFAILRYLTNLPFNLPPPSTPSAVWAEDRAGTWKFLTLLRYVNFVYL